MSSTYEIEIIQGDPDHWVSQSQQRAMLYETGVKSIKWLSGQAGPGLPKNGIQTWRIECDEAQLTLSVLKSNVLSIKQIETKL